MNRDWLGNLASGRDGIGVGIGMCRVECVACDSSLLGNNEGPCQALPWPPPFPVVAWTNTFNANRAR